MASLTIIDHSLCDEGSHHAAYASSVASAALAAGQEVLVAANTRFRGTSLHHPGIPVRPVFRGRIYDSGSLLAGLDRCDRWGLDPAAGSRRSSSAAEWIKSCLKPSPGRVWNRSAARFAEDCRTLFQHRVLRSDDRVLLATASEVELSGLCRFLANHPQTILANWNLLFHFNLLQGRPTSYPGQLQRLRMMRDRFCNALRLVPYHQLRLFATTSTLADQFNRMGLVRFEELAWPIADAFRPDEPVRSSRPVIAGRIGAKGNSGARETASPEEKPVAERPLRVVMPGTVRREKGQTRYLAQLVAQLGPDYLQTGRLQFVLQAPRRPWFQRRKIQLGEPVQGVGIESRQPVVTCRHPLPPDEYQSLIETTDIGLLMYDRESYYARRAGVMCELLSRGRPVIVSAGTWLGDELEEYRNDRAFALANGPLARRSLERGELDFSPGNLPHPGGVLAFDEGDHPIEISLDLEPDEAGVVIQFQWHHPVCDGTYCRISLADADPGTTFAAIAGHRQRNQPVAVFLRTTPGARRCRIRLTNAFHDASASVQNLVVTTLDQRAAELPLGQVGLAVAETDDLAPAIREMCRHYDHYRRTAGAWSGEWFDRQNARRTVEQLMQAPPPMVARRAA